MYYPFIITQCPYLKSTLCYMSGMNGPAPSSDLKMTPFFTTKQPDLGLSCVTFALVMLLLTDRHAYQFYEDTLRTPSRTRAGPTDPRGLWTERG